MNDERFEEGIRLFNSAEFFDAHEVWEDLWQEYRGDDRVFLQALIQVAAGLYHAQCENDKGAKSQLRKGLAKLADFRSDHQTIRSGVLYEEVAEWLLRYHEEPPAASASGPYPRIERVTHYLSS